MTDFMLNLTLAAAPSFGDMEITNHVALVTGANRGLGRHFAAELQRRGARTVYAAARNPETIDLPGVVPLRLDVTNDAEVRAAAAAAGDVTMLVNNAGVASLGRIVDGDLDDARREMEVHYWGTARMVRAFAPILAANGGGGILNVLSASALQVIEFGNTYAASKAAAWQLTNAVRLELSEQGTQVTGLAMALVATEMSAWAREQPGVSFADPAVVVQAALDGFEAGAFEVFGDEATREWRSRMGESAEALYPQAVPVAR